MILTWRECNDCGRRWKKSECLRWDDPQAPFGIEVLCPHCEGLTVARVHWFVRGISILLAGAAGLGAGTLFSRL